MAAAVLLCLLLVAGVAAAILFGGDGGDDAVATADPDLATASSVDDEPTAPALDATPSPAAAVTPEPEPTPTVRLQLVIPTPTPTPVPTPTDEQLLRQRGYTQQSGAPVVDCAAGGEFRRVITERQALRVRSAPEETADVILELATGFEVEWSSPEEPRVIDRLTWVLVTLPDPDGRYVGCGWVAANFLASPVAESLAVELRPVRADGSTVPGPFSSACRSGWDLVFAGTTFEARFDVSICRTANGRLEYHGRGTYSGLETRLAACEVWRGVYIARDDPVEFRVVDGRDAGGDSELVVTGDVIPYEGFLVDVRGSASTSSLRSC